MAFPFGQFPRGDEHDAPARPRIEEPDVGEVGGRCAGAGSHERHRRDDSDHGAGPVSYTHLDVYKRQLPVRAAGGMRAACGGSGLSFDSKCSKYSL